MATHLIKTSMCMFLLSFYGFYKSIERLERPDTAHAPFAALSFFFATISAIWSFSSSIDDIEIYNMACLVCTYAGVISMIAPYFSTYMLLTTVFLAPVVAFIVTTVLLVCAMFWKK